MFTVPGHIYLIEWIFYMVFLLCICIFFPEASLFFSLFCLFLCNCYYCYCYYYYYIWAGLKFAGTKDGNVQELLYEYAVYFLNEVVHPAYVIYSINIYWYIDTRTCMQTFPDQACFYYWRKYLSQGIVSIC